MSTRVIVNWVLDRDSEIDEGSGEGEGEGEGDDDDESEFSKALGPRGERLREIAVSEGASYCVSCLDGWLSGCWPPKKKKATVRILDVKGLTRRGIWINIYHTVYDIDTNLGPAVMYPPNAAYVARVVLKTEGSMSPGMTVKVPKAFWSKIEALKPIINT